MIVYGRQPVREALRGRRSVERVWATEGAARAEWLDRVAIERTSGERIASLAETPDHQGICAEVASYPYARAGELLGPEDALVVALDEVQDPRNLGAVCRVAECAGAAGVVIPERRAAEVTPVVCRASAGAVEHLPVARVRNLADWLGEAKAAGAWAYGAALEGAVAYDQPDYRGRVVLVLGSEGRGLRPRVAAVCDQTVTLPMAGRIESLNVSTAAAALIYGILHFRRHGP
ncbi:MAG: 23S rRNA (guanosine(2251)-2'-O)-methyltransferase RlmB [Actinomycetota bacterium]|jgi:23S rRNA (guanosine2251-2'-O)-methyltransferase|nr:23S rRNA (guanosine(2251)-2'-O)-methyltransferase RlmB [Actinomycetota bacterium]MDQ3319496.1 23S rRNA (guanosine(2251)-2'-O)-methyltransferase RlmB [Actinomycetota bacterium]MDQ3356271.1 23S rRNA (guanosine(2251)-2'-O)-methyltransferase RlmB [Actinomycetota bacterium]